MAQGQRPTLTHEEARRVVPRPQWQRPGAAPVDAARRSDAAPVVATGRARVKPSFRAVKSEGL